MIKDKVKPELLPCPFCGSNKDLSIEEDMSEEDGDKHAYACHVRCGCGARGRNLYPICWVESDGHAIEAWNDRFIPSTIPGKEEDRVQVSMDALIIINSELNDIERITKTIVKQLTPVKMVK
jgi:Lar family restriction alleviation protein